MNITTRTERDICIMQVIGNMDAASAAPFEAECAAILQAQPAKLLIDLAGVGYVSSAGLREVLKITKHCKSQNISLALCSLVPEVAEVFSVTGFMNILAIHDDRAAALASFE